MNTIQHSVPVWAVGPRPRNPKFGGGRQEEAFRPVETRLHGIQKLSSQVQTASGLPLLTSFHIGLELEIDMPYARLYSPWAIKFDRLVRGIRDGDFPRVLALTAPCFGFEGAEKGGILSTEKWLSERAYELHCAAIRHAQELAELQFGEGKVIWWPGFDSMPVGRFTEHYTVEAALERFFDFWCKVLDTTNGQVHFEFKPGDPGIDYIRTLEGAIAFAYKVNSALGRKAMLLNNEWAHILATGISVASATARTIETGLFDGFVHVNWGERCPVNIDHLIQQGLPTPVQTDWDWHVGYFQHPTEWEDQLAAVRNLLAWRGKVFAEHDVYSQLDNPFDYVKLSIDGLEELARHVTQGPPPVGESLAAARKPSGKKLK
ncbi:MAG: hypothetical protein J5J00_07995 [Deltaproteobacteria bacterium]|nr:hypothetical protein [Deltaproteobacteria bacterium]